MNDPSKEVEFSLMVEKTVGGATWKLGVHGASSSLDGATVQAIWAKRAVQNNKDHVDEMLSIAEYDPLTAINLPNPFEAVEFGLEVVETTSGFNWKLSVRGVATFLEGAAKQAVCAQEAIWKDRNERREGSTST